VDQLKDAGVRRGRVSQFVGRKIVRVLGWKVIGEVPDVPKAIFIAAPHTSNWDAFWMIVTAHAMGIRLSWMGKKSLFKFPLGIVLKGLGGVSVDRSKSNDTVKEIATEFERRRGMYLAIAASASRRKKDYWRSGFYHIATEAKVPLLCGCVDYGRKEVGILGVVEVTGDLAADMDKIRKLYEGRQGRFPDEMTPVRLRSEVSEPRDGTK